RVAERHCARRGLELEDIRSLDPERSWLDNHQATGKGGSSTMKLVLFDCDGTLVDSGDFIHRCMAESFADAGLTPPEQAQTHSIIGLSLPLAIARLLGREPDEQVNWLTQRYKDNFVRLRQAPDFSEPLY